MTSNQLTLNWAIFIVFTVVAFLNNFHGYFTLRTVNNTFNSKFFFFIRVLVQLAVFYLTVMIYQQR